MTATADRARDEKSFSDILRMIGVVQIVGAVVLCVATWPDSSSLSSYGGSGALRSTLIGWSVGYAVAGAVASVLWFALAHIIEQNDAIRRAITLRNAQSPSDVDAVRAPS